MKGYYTSGHDIFIELQDPIGQCNYYRWDLDEPQYRCRSCGRAFTTSIMSSKTIIDRQDYEGVPLGLDLVNGYSKFIGGELFYALNGREVAPEPAPGQYSHPPLTIRPAHQRPY